MSIIRSGYRDAAPALLRSQGDGDIASSAGAAAGVALKSNIEAEYQKQTDFFDLQKEETDNLLKMIDGLEGKDYQVMMDEIVLVRDKFKEIFKGKSMRDYNTAEFQAQLFNEKKRLADLKNSINTSKSKFTNAFETAETTPFFRRGDAETWLREQMELPPSKRQQDPTKFILGDPQFRNASEYILDWAKRQGTNRTYITDKKTGLITGAEAVNYKAVYDEHGTFVMADEEIDRQLTENPWLVGVIQEFKRTPDENKVMHDGGFDKTSLEDLRSGFKEYVQTIKGLDNYQEKNRMMGESGGRPTTYDKKEQAEDENVVNLQKRLLTKDGNLDGILIGLESGGSNIGDLKDIKGIKQGDGRIKVIYKEAVKSKSAVNKDGAVLVDREYRLLVDPNNKDQISQLYSFFKNLSDAKDTSVTSDAGKTGDTDLPDDFFNQ